MAAVQRPPVLGAASKAHHQKAGEMHFVQQNARQPCQRCTVNDHFPGAASRAQHRAETDITIREEGELNRRKPKGATERKPLNLVQAL